ncbi:MAG: hypothetical protein ACREYE_20940 [Gammaproteobacteria bacterium]
MSDPFRPKGGFDLVFDDFLSDLSPNPSCPERVGEITLRDAIPRDPRGPWFETGGDPDQNDNTAYGSIHIPP